MGQPIDFDGSNVVMRAPEGAENVQDMHVYRTRHSCVSCWTFTPEEIAEINQTGRIFLSVLAGGQQPPVYVGSESTCREVMVYFGPVWPMAQRPPSPETNLLVDVDRLAASIVTAACELDGPADPASDDTIFITLKDLEAVVHRHVTAALESQ